MLKNAITKLITKYGALLCTVSVAVMALGVDSCRNSFYQPEEPDDLRTFLMNRKK